MKKVVAILAAMFCTIVLTSCTDSAEELNERIENENQTELQQRQLIDKRELGGDPDDDVEQ